MIEHRRTLSVLVMLLGVTAMSVTAHVWPGDGFEVWISDGAALVILTLSILLLLGRLTVAEATTATLVLGHVVFIRRLAVGSGLSDEPFAVQYLTFMGIVLLAGMAFIALGSVRGFVISGLGWVVAFVVLAVGPLGRTEPSLAPGDLLVLGAGTAMAMMMFRLLSSTAETMHGDAQSATADARLAYLDELTGLPNRRQLRLELRRAIDERRRHRMAVVMFDLDHFKAINDTLGHDTGDLVLQRTATIGRAVMRDIDVLGRWGGEEFIALLPGADLEDGKEIAERCRRSLASVTGIDGVTASFGVTEIADDDTIEEVLSRVDRALYDAKRNGRNAVVTSPVGQVGLSVDLRGPSPLRHTPLGPDGEGRARPDVTAIQPDRPVGHRPSRP